MNALQVIRQAEAEAKLKAAAEFEHLAEQLAKGEPLPDGVLNVLVAANKTADDLEKAVALAAERQRLKPLADAFQQIVQDKAKAIADLKVADEKAAAELDAHREEVVLRLAPLRQRVDALREQEMQSRAAKSRLTHLDSKPQAARQFVTVEDE